MTLVSVNICVMNTARSSLVCKNYFGGLFLFQPNRIGRNWKLVLLQSVRLSRCHSSKKLMGADIDILEKTMYVSLSWFVYVCSCICESITTCYLSWFIDLKMVKQTAFQRLLFLMWLHFVQFIQVQELVEKSHDNEVSVDQFVFDVGHKIFVKCHSCLNHFWFFILVDCVVNWHIDVCAVWHLELVFLLRDTQDILACGTKTLNSMGTK